MRRTPLRSVSTKRRASSSEWDAVKTAVRLRSKGRCEVVLEGVRCLRDAKDAHHVVKRSQGGSDSVHNVMDVCRPCHDRTDFAFYRGRLWIVALGSERFSCTIISKPSKWSWT